MSSFYSSEIGSSFNNFSNRITAQLALANCPNCSVSTRDRNTRGAGGGAGPEGRGGGASQGGGEEDAGCRSRGNQLIGAIRIIII